MSLLSATLQGCMFGKLREQQQLDALCTVSGTVSGDPAMSDTAVADSARIAV